MRHLRRPLDLALDLLLYIPVGAVVQARTVLPELAEAGRDHLASRVELVRAIGSFVAAQAPGAPRPTPRATLAPAARRATATAKVTPPSGPSWPAGGRDVVVVVEEEPPARRARTRLPIEGYDSLAASQIVARLADLDDAGLREVATYEAGHRNRRSVLAKVTQLRRG